MKMFSTAQPRRGAYSGTKAWFDVDEGDDAPTLLRRCQRLEQQGGHADAFWTEDLADAAAGPTADPCQSIEIDQPCRQYIRRRFRQVAQALQRANTKLLLDSGDSAGDLGVTPGTGLIARRHGLERLELSFLSGNISIPTVVARTAAAERYPGAAS